ncbi:MAG TPA: Hsp20/alpha crystallin family protein [Thermoanaerobaculia bacterium]|jgi:HSP20 family protein|nr:Hsp20/alpha crystallin family protein [Thermoanaerobaculia bacterium]
MTDTEPTQAREAARDVDQTVERMEQLYRVVTGRDAPPADAGYAPIPAEKDPAEYVERRLNQLLELLGAAPESARGATAWIPPMSVWESEKEILIRIDLPGVSREQVEVTSQDNVLTVSGARRDTSDPQFRPRTRECPAGLFRRVMFVPAGLRSAEPTAEMKAGVLELRIKKETPEVTAPRTVRVN